ncbi:MAG: tRNA pseudouridine(55) synthase TruB, partial [Methyloceanibacter sp.]
MARRRKGLPVHGWLIFDKPQGMTSTQAVARVKRLYEAAKAGHAGTLDPLATGVLPIALGEATKTVPFVVEGSKEYRFTVRLGAETNTDDAEGKVVATSDRRPTRAEIEAKLPDFTGEIDQVPPRFSALKVDGARAYDLAREEEDFELAPRRVSIAKLDLVDHPDTDHCVLEARCGKGTYVRALARDLGRALGSFGHVEALRRTRVGGFGEER